MPTCKRCGKVGISAEMRKMPRKIAELGNSLEEFMANQTWACKEREACKGRVRQARKGNR